MKDQYTIAKNEDIRHENSLMLDYNYKGIVSSFTNEDSSDGLICVADDNKQIVIASRFNGIANIGLIDISKIIIIDYLHDFSQYSSQNRKRIQNLVNSYSEITKHYIQENGIEEMEYTGHKECNTFGYFRRLEIEKNNEYLMVSGVAEPIDEDDYNRFIIGISAEDKSYSVVLSNKRALPLDLEQKYYRKEFGTRYSQLIDSRLEKLHTERPRTGRSIFGQIHEMMRFDK